MQFDPGINWKTLFHPLCSFQLLGLVSYALVLVCFPGCQISDDTSKTTTLKDILAPVQPEIDAVQIDIIYIERDEKDPLLTQMLWGEIDQVGTVDLETRSRLRESGFRIGLVGMSPPRSLQRLLGFSTDLTDTADTSRHNELAGRTVVLRSGGETEIQTSTIYPEMTLTLPGQSEPATYNNVRFVFRSQLERLQDGWVNLHLTPEIHHGTSQLRPVPGATNWELKGAQEIITFDELRFTVSLNVGEMIILSADHLADQLIADHFFVNRDIQRPQRRLVVIRLSDMKKIEPLYDN